MEGYWYLLIMLVIYLGNQYDFGLYVWLGSGWDCFGDSNEDGGGGFGWVVVWMMLWESDW